MKYLKSKSVRIFGVLLGLLLSLVGVIAVSEAYVRSKVPVSLGFSNASVEFWDSGYVVFEGTWIIEGADHAYPLNVSKVVCRAETKTCTDSIARIYQGSTPMLSVDEDAHEITKWDKDTLIYQSETDCVDYLYTISRHSKQISGVRKLKPNVAKGFCGDMDSELKLRLGKGWDVSWQMEKDARPVALNVVVIFGLLAFSVVRIRRIYKESLIV